MQATFLIYALLSTYLLILVVVCVYGLHRYYLVYLYYKHRHNTPKPRGHFAELPRVTVQLPMYNERLVARRVIEQACRIDYPRDRLEIQVLDDSTDDSSDVVRETVARMRHEGHNVVLLQRNNRRGYKAGALQEGMDRTDGDFLCIFDADFVPPSGMLKDTIDLFTDESIGMVQVRWGHVNREQSMLTKIQAVLLDGHFVVEHGARSRSGRFMNFNGTAGIWRKECIVDAGGWQHDTLTEDLDLSYRAQLRGWKFVFVPSFEVPAEVPPVMEAFKAQQHRWTKGGAQTCKKLLPTILRSELPWRVKLEAFFHLTSHVVYPFVVLLTLLVFPALSLKLIVLEVGTWSKLLFDISLFLLATFSFSSFYVCSQRELDRSWWDSVKLLPALMSLGIGIAINNALAMFEGFFGGPSEFVRTPKYGVETQDKGLKLSAQSYEVKRVFHLQPWIELLMGVYMLVCVVLCISNSGIWMAIPFLCIFAVGYLYVGLSTLLGPWWRRKCIEQNRPAALPL